MPEERFGTCSVCGRHNCFTTLIIGEDNGWIVTGWACGRCLVDLSAVRQMILKNHGGSGSQERTPGAGGAGK